MERGTPGAGPCAHSRSTSTFLWPPPPRARWRGASWEDAMGWVGRYHEPLTRSSTPGVGRFAHHEKPGSLHVVYTAWCFSRMPVKGVTAIWIFTSLLRWKLASRRPEHTR